MLDAVDVRGLLSLLLPDGSLVCYRSPAGGFVQLTLTSGIHDSAFLEEKVAELRQFIPTKAQIVHYNSSPRANGKTTPCLRFRVSTNRLRPIYNLLYPGDVRTITSAALGLLGAQAAAWLWAEGCRPQRQGSIELTRVGACAEEAQLIGSWLAMLTGATSRLLLIESTVPRRPRLFFEADQAEKVRTALLPYAPASRRHLFTAESWDVSAIRSARTELLLGDWSDPPEGSQAAPLARTAPV